MRTFIAAGVLIAAATGKEALFERAWDILDDPGGCQENCVTFFYTGTRSPNKITN
jgi:hypothetical protein